MSRDATTAFARTLVDEWARRLDVNVRGLLHGIAADLPLF